ncbi:MAG: peptidoglycan editing factor PgeF [Simkaniaceae bacterium]
MYEIKKGKFRYLIFEKLAMFSNIVHGVFLKEHDFSISREILQEISEEWSLECMALGRQVHKANIAHVQKNQKPVRIYAETDGLMTGVSNVGLVVNHADCQPALIYDPKKQVISAVHCGWRGSVRNIYARAIFAMQKEYGSDPKDLIVCIGPSLGPLAAEFINFPTELPAEFHEFQIKPYYFDFWAISESQLLKLGVLRKNIEIAGICTYSNPTHFFSYRRNKEKGRHGSFIALRQTS